MIVYHDSIGTCMGSEWQDCTTVIDTAAPIYSGDVVRLGYVHAGRVHHILKRLRTHSGLWYAECSDGVFPIHPMGFVPDAIHKVIAREPRLGPVPILADFPRADTKLRSYYDHVTAEARAAWAAGDEQLGVTWPGLDAVVGVRPRRTRSRSQGGAWHESHPRSDRADSLRHPSKQPHVTDGGRAHHHGEHWGHAHVQHGGAGR